MKKLDFNGDRMASFILYIFQLKSTVQKVLVTISYLIIFILTDGLGQEAFNPDKSLLKLAQKYDSTYFPLFLRTLSCIEDSNFEILDTFFVDSAIQLTDNEEIPPIEEYFPGVVPVYSNKLINSSDYNVLFPIQWKDIDGTDNSWNLYFQTLNWSSEYFESNNRDSIFTGFKILNEWIAAHTNYPSENEPFAFSDHAVSYRLKTLIKAYKRFLDLEYNQPEFFNRLRLSVLNHIFLMVTLEKYTSYHNHGIIMDNSLIIALQNLDDFKLRDDFINFAYKRLFENYRYSYTSEGIHKEHSPCYHCQFTRELENAVSLTGKNEINVPESILNTLKNATEYARLLEINGFIPKIGDCAGNKKATHKPIGSHANYFNIFPESGWGIITDTMLNAKFIFQCDFFSRTHYQEDETSFIVNVDGHDLIIDPGLYSYTPGTKHHSYMTSARAHNLMLVDNENFKIDLKNTGLSGITRYYIDSLSTTASEGIVEMTHPHYLRKNVEIYRQLAFIEGNFIAIKDISVSADTHTYSQLFHLAPDAKIIADDGIFQVTWPGHPYSLVFSSNADEYEIIEGQEDPVQGWYFPEFNKAMPAKVLILKKKGKGIIIKTDIRITNPETGTKSKRSEKHADELFKKLETIEREMLTHNPPPEKWRPSRK